MKFDIYGRFRIEVLREGGAWVAYRPGSGTRVHAGSLHIPPDLTAGEIAAFLDDLFHELAGPGQHIRPVEE